jgi:hypothetical protein
MFTRAESEIFNAYSHSSMSVRDGDDLYKWASNEAYRCRDLLYGSTNALARAITNEYTPYGVQSIDLHDPLDGNQDLWLHRRRMLPALISMLKDIMFAGVQYTKFKIMRGDNGCSILGSFNAGQWYLKYLYILLNLGMHRIYY